MSDVKLNNNSVLIEGNVGIGTNSPANLLHVVGGGPVTIENPNGEADILFKSGNNPSWQVGTNNEGWYVWDNAYRLVIKPGGNVGIGTNSPNYKLHVEGGEIRSSGSSAGFSFTDRFVSGKSWHWYAANQEARLGPDGPGGDALTIRQNGNNNYAVQINGTLLATVSELRGLSANGNPEASTIRCRSAAFTLENPAAPLSVPIPTELVSDPSLVAAPPPPPPPPIPPPSTPVPARIALFHDFVNNQKDGLVINYQNRYKDGVKIEGTVQATGALTQASSIALKENVAELSGQEAMAALQGLNAVKYNYKADSQKEQRIGFIAEDVPDLVASSERDRLSPMDLIAVLTKAVQEQQKTIAELSTAMKSLKLQEGGH
jgi:Chaperone of endosialidase